MSWRSIPRRLRRLAVVMWTAGTGCLTLGVWGDRHNFWDSWPFLLNLYSALTGALFGIPVAVLGLTAISRAVAQTFDQQERINRSKSTLAYIRQCISIDRAFDATWGFQKSEGFAQIDFSDPERLRRTLPGEVDWPYVRKIWTGFKELNINMVIRWPDERTYWEGWVSEVDLSMDSIVDLSPSFDDSRQRVEIYLQLSRRLRGLIDYGDGPDPDIEEWELSSMRMDRAEDFAIIQKYGAMLKHLSSTVQFLDDYYLPAVNGEQFFR